MICTYCHGGHADKDCPYRQGEGDGTKFEASPPEPVFNYMDGEPPAYDTVPKSKQ